MDAAFHHPVMDIEHFAKTKGYEQYADRLCDAMSGGDAALGFGSGTLISRPD